MNNGGISEKVSTVDRGLSAKAWKNIQGFKSFIIVH
jgi:hypothetical protein